jgi:hypothetical protein
MGLSLLAWDWCGDSTTGAIERASVKIPIIVHSDVAQEPHTTDPSRRSPGQHLVELAPARDRPARRLASGGCDQRLLDQLGVTRFAMYVQDYGAPVGWRLALARRDSIAAIVTQNGNGYEAGFVEEFWKPVREYRTDQNPRHARRSARHGVRRRRLAPRHARPPHRDQAARTVGGDPGDGLPCV